MEVVFIEKAKEKRATVYILFSIYLILLALAILLKMQLSTGSLPSGRDINLIPFAGSAYVNSRIYYNEIAMNILAFVPFGIYISMLRPSWPLWKRVLPAALASLAFETIQYIFGIGVTDITDLIDNTLGGFLGCAAYMVQSRILKQRTHYVLCIVAIVGTVGLLALLGSMGVFNGYIRFAGSRPGR